MMKKFLVILYIFLINTVVIHGNVKLPGIFSNNMVLQRGMKVPVWGWADPGEKVTASLGGHEGGTIANAAGKWKLFLGPLDAGGPFELIIAGKDSLTITNVLVGEVWVCSGQSNMALEVENSLNSLQEISEAGYPQIRQFQVKRTKSLTPLDDMQPIGNSAANWLNTWEICSPATAGHFTAVGYYFARYLCKNLNVPVGIIHASWGGTTAEAWTPSDTLESDPQLNLIIRHWPDYNNDEEWLKEEYASFVKEVGNARQEGKTVPLYFNQPSVLYNGIIVPVIPYGIKGVAWYQGESNAYRAYQYRILLPALIKKWRHNWGEGDFPFLIVQLANYQFEPQVFPELRESQNMALSLPNTAIAVTIDIGDSADIHPVNKQEVGRRLFLAADNIAYGENILFTGPVFASMNITGDRCHLSFTGTGEGLTSKDQKNLKGFMIAGVDKVFHTAQCSLKGNEITVWSSQVALPVAVRYAWANNPQGCNLYNMLGKKAYLPASPFRTDDWPGLTHERY
jgi:sialate O-acetylesterase